MSSPDPNHQKLAVTKVNEGVVINIDGVEMFLPIGACIKLGAMLVKGQQVDHYTGTITVHRKTGQTFASEAIENELKPVPYA